MNIRPVVVLSLLLSMQPVSLLQAEEVVAHPGELVFQSRCALCHQLPEPAMLKPGQWQRILQTMQKRMQRVGIQPLQKEETIVLLDYLSQHARN